MRNFEEYSRRQPILAGPSFQDCFIADKGHSERALKDKVLLKCLPDTVDPRGPKAE
jgi:hypothetical protein